MRALAARMRAHELHDVEDIELKTCFQLCLRYSVVLQTMLVHVGAATTTTKKTNKNKKQNKNQQNIYKQFLENNSNKNE